MFLLLLFVFVVVVFVVVVGFCFVCLFSVFSFCVYVCLFVVLLLLLLVVCCCLLLLLLGVGWEGGQLSVDVVKRSGPPSCRLSLFCRQRNIKGEKNNFASKNLSFDGRGQQQSHETSGLRDTREARWDCRVAIELVVCFFQIGFLSCGRSVVAA